MTDPIKAYIAAYRKINLCDPTIEQVGNMLRVNGRLVYINELPRLTRELQDVLNLDLCDE